MYPLPNTTASENLLKSLIKRREEVPTDFYGTGAMIDRNWTTANFEMRHSLTNLQCMDSTMSFATTHHSTNHKTHANVHSVISYVRDTT